MSNTVELDKRIYLDYASTTPIDPIVLDTMLPYFDESYGNPSSLHTSGRKARLAIEGSRAKIASIINAKPREVVFTGSGTEADNMAIIGVARAYRDRGNHIIVSSIEHKAVLESAESLKKEGFAVSVLDVDRNGLIDIEQCLSLINADTILVSVMYANNEIGTIEPIAELATAIKAKRGQNLLPLLHTDACQAGGYLSLDVDELGVDLMTINSSKIYGPKGVGALYKREGVKIAPIIMGGEQENNLRAGTESVPLIVGFATALKRAEMSRKEETDRILLLRDYLIAELKRELPNHVLNGHPRERLPNNVHISFPYIEGESILLKLDHKGIEISTGSACSALDLRPSHVLLAIKTDPALLHGSIRLSLGKYTVKSDIDRVIAILKETVIELTQLSALTTVAAKI